MIRLRCPAVWILLLVGLLLAVVAGAAGAYLAVKQSGSDREEGFLARNRQYLWIKILYAASSVAVVSSGRSTSLPFSNIAPARTSATRWGALTARQRDWAASISL